MSVKTLRSVREKVFCTGSYLIGSHQVFPHQKMDYCNLCNGLTLWCGILLDHDLMLGPKDQEHRAFAGRVEKLHWLQGEKICNLTNLLVLLDELDDLLLKEISGSERFKGAFFIKKIEASAHADVLSDLIQRTVRCMLEGRLSDSAAVRLLHQSFCFLKKIQVDRPDLEKSAKAEFLSFETILGNRSSLRDNPEAMLAIEEMNTLLRRQFSDFNLAAFRPKHGPGVVADTNVKSWYDKYLNTRTDARIEYLLGRNGLGTQKDYCPWLTQEKSSRTSRFISVPKTWKKLRGISSEPVELQFYQQAILARIDNMFSTSKWWQRRVNLHDQRLSRDLALAGSIHDGYATIDLSAASDSVTLELVKLVFKGTPVLPWLLGSRSVFTSCDGHFVRLHKFAPMGSACCFPVECIVFTLAAQVASDRTSLPFEKNSQTVRVFGDDIILDGYAAPECIRILEMLGFQTNVQKSYISGGFREACGVEAYRGEQIQPLRFKRLDWVCKPGPTSIENIATALSYSNTLYESGYHDTRAFLLSILFSKQYQLGKTCRDVVRYIPVTFSGARGSLASPEPTNFNRLLKWDSNLQTFMVRSIGLRVRPLSKLGGSEMSELFSWQKYHEWQLSHQLGCSDFDKRWEKGWIDLSHFSEVDQRLPLGFRMVPTEKWVQWTYHDSLV